MFEAKIKFYSSDLINLLCFAFEGGVGRWREVHHAGGNHWYDIENPDWKVLVYDIESGNNNPLVLDADAINRGLNVMAKDYPDDFGDLINSEFNAKTSDNFLQCCVFNEVKYSY